MRRGLDLSAQTVEGCQKENGAEAAATTTRYATAAHLAHHVCVAFSLFRDFAMKLGITIKSGTIYFESTGACLCTSKNLRASLMFGVSQSCRHLTPEFQSQILEA